MKNKAKMLLVFFYLWSCPFSFLLNGNNKKPGPLPGLQGVNRPLVVDNNQTKRELHRKPHFRAQVRLIYSVPCWKCPQKNSA